ncbi:MAG: hypothetical protein U1F06_10545 [Steroidobacteraceae bacterium]
MPAAAARPRPPLRLVGRKARRRGRGRRHPRARSAVLRVAEKVAPAVAGVVRA